jgi:RHS repeat-associated protein
VTGQGQEVKARFDYMPFGEEITVGRFDYGGVGLRQKFTGYERDSESGLDYAKARYYANAQGRFTSVDPLMASARPQLPQSWNRFAYVLNNPLTLTDPSGTIDGDANKPRIVVVLFTGGHWSIKVSESGGPATDQISRIQAGGSTKGLGEESTNDSEEMSMGQKIKNDFPGTEVIVAGPDAQPQLFNQLANTDTSKGPDHIIIYGFSMGGVSAVALSNNLTRNGQTVDQLITVDPAREGGLQFGTAPLRNADKVKDAVNFTEYPPLNVEVQGVNNIYVSNRDRQNSNTPMAHTNLDDIISPRAVKIIEEKLKKISP